jgi:hypothetical protein
MICLHSSGHPVLEKHYVLSSKLPLWLCKNWSIQSLPLLSLPPSPPPPFSTAFGAHPCVLYLHRCHVLRDYRCSVILLSFPEFHRAAARLHSCSAYEFVCGHACFCVDVYLLDLSSTAMSLWSCSLHFPWCPPIAVFPGSPFCFAGVGTYLSSNTALPWLLWPHSEP